MVSFCFVYKINSPCRRTSRLGGPSNAPSNGGQKSPKDLGRVSTDERTSVDSTSALARALDDKLKLAPILARKLDVASGSASASSGSFSSRVCAGCRDGTSSVDQFTRYINYNYDDLFIGRSAVSCRAPLPHGMSTLLVSLDTVRMEFIGRSIQRCACLNLTWISQLSLFGPTAQNEFISCSYLRC